MSHFFTALFPLQCHAGRRDRGGGAAGVRAWCKPILRSRLPGDLPVRAAAPHCSEGRHRQGERGIGRCMAERRGRERKSGPVLAHARRPAHEGGRKEGGGMGRKYSPLPPFFLPLLPSFFLPGASDRSCGSAVGSRRRQCLRFSYVKLVLRARSSAPSLASLARFEVEQPRRGPLVRPRRLREDGVRAGASRETRRRRRRRERECLTSN